MNTLALEDTRPVTVGQHAPRRERSAFELYRDGLIHSSSATVTALGFSLIPLFLILDYFSMPYEEFVRFAVYRGVATGLVLVQYFIIRNTRPRRASYLHGYAFSLMVGWTIAWMTVELGGFDSPYYAGLNLVVIAVNLLLPWRALHSALNGLMVMGIYVTLNALFGGTFQLAALLGNLFFMGGTLVITVAITYAKHRLIEKEFNLRAELVEANANLDRSRQELKAARDALWGEMEVAKRIQTALLPQNRQVGPYQVAARMLPAAEVGGDYYDIIDGGEGRHWVAIGDVSGHGVESGLVMMMTQTSILSLVKEKRQLRPSGVFQAVNDALVENISRLGSGHYMTLNVVQLREEGLTIAGKHQDVLVWRRTSGRVEPVSNEGCWLGMVSDVSSQVPDQLIPMEEGDVALFFTDGATEAMNAQGEMFGDARLAAHFGRVAHLPLDQALEALFSAVAAFQARQEDDITLMLVRRTAPSGERRVPPPA